MKDLQTFFRRRYVLVVCTLAASIFTYATYWIHSGDILTDSETYILDPSGTSTVFDMVGRFGLTLTKKLFSTDAYVPALFLSYTMLAMALAAFIIDYGVWHFAEDGKRKKLEMFYLPFNCLFVSSPVLTHQFYFYYQAFEVSFAFSLGAIAAYLVMRWCIEGNVFRLAAGMGLMVWSFATYQSLAPYYIAVQSLFFLIYFMYGDPPRRPWFLAFKLAFFFVAGILIYMAVSQAYLNLRYGESFSPQTNPYMGWGKNPVCECIADMKDDVKRILQSVLPGYSQYYLPISCLFLILAVWNVIRRRKQILLPLLAVFIFISAPYEMTLLLGSYQILRAQLTYSIVFAATAGMTMVWLANTRIVKYSMFLLLTVMLFGQLDTANRIEQMVHTVAEADRIMAQSIYMDTEELRLQEDGTVAPMVFIGQWKPELPPMGMQPWDATGISFFTIDSGYPHGSVRIARLMRCMGLRTSEPAEEQYYNAVEYAEDMPVWPAEGSVKMQDGVLIVKLSEN